MPQEASEVLAQDRIAMVTAVPLYQNASSTHVGSCIAYRNICPTMREEEVGGAAGLALHNLVAWHKGSTCGTKQLRVDAMTPSDHLHDPCHIDMAIR